MKKSYDDSTFVGRTLIAFKCDNLRQLANMLEKFPQDLSNRIRIETFEKLIKKEAKKRSINFNWIKTGQGGMLINKETGQYPEEISETPSNHPTNDRQPVYIPPDHLLRKAEKVLKSNSSFRRALDSNIESFYEAIELREDLDVARAELKQYKITLKEQNKLIEQQQHEIDNMKSIIAAGSQTISQQHNDIETLKAQVDSLNATIFAIKSA